MPITYEILAEHYGFLVRDRLLDCFITWLHEEDHYVSLFDVYILARTAFHFARLACPE